MTLGVGVLGYGLWGEAHATALAKLPRFFTDAPSVECDVVVDQDEDALAEAVDRLGFERYATA